MGDAVLGTFRVKVVHSDNERSECLRLTVRDKRLVERGECTAYQIIYDKLQGTPSRAFVTRHIAVFLNDISTRKLTVTDTPQRDVQYYLYNYPADETAFPPGHEAAFYERVDLATPAPVQTGFSVGEVWRGTIDFGPLAQAICAPPQLWDGEAIEFAGLALCSAGDLPDAWLPPSHLESPFAEEIKIASERDFHELAHENYYGTWKADHATEVFSERWISPELGERARIPQLLNASDSDGRSPRDAAHAWLEVSESLAPFIELLSEQHILPFFESSSHPKLRIVLQPVHALTSETLQALRAPARDACVHANAAASSAESPGSRPDRRGEDDGRAAGQQSVTAAASAADGTRGAQAGEAAAPTVAADDGGEREDPAADDAGPPPPAAPTLAAEEMDDESEQQPVAGMADQPGPLDDAASQAPATLHSAPTDAFVRTSEASASPAKRAKTTPGSSARKRALPPDSCDASSGGRGPSDAVATGGTDPSAQRPGGGQQRDDSPSKKRARKSTGRKAGGAGTSTPSTPSEATLGDWGRAPPDEPAPQRTPAVAPRPGLRLHVPPRTSNSVCNVKTEPKEAETGARPSAPAHVQCRLVGQVFVLSDSESEERGDAAPERLRGSGVPDADEPLFSARRSRSGRTRAPSACARESGASCSSSPPRCAPLADPAADASETPLRMRGAGGKGPAANGKASAPQRKATVRGDDRENGAARLRRSPSREGVGAAAAPQGGPCNGGAQKGTTGSPVTKPSKAPQGGQPRPRAPGGAQKRTKPLKAPPIAVNPLKMATISVPKTVGETEPDSEDEELAPPDAFDADQDAAAKPTDPGKAGGPRPAAKTDALRGAQLSQGSAAAAGTGMNAVYKQLKAKMPAKASALRSQPTLAPIPATSPLLQSPLYPKGPSSKLHHGFLLHLQPTGAGQTPSDRQFQGFLARASINSSDSGLNRSPSEMLSPIDGTPLRPSPPAGSTAQQDGPRCGGDGQPRPVTHSHSGDTRLVVMVDIDDTLLKTFRIHPTNPDAMARLEAYFAHPDWQLKAQAQSRERHPLMVLSTELARILDEQSDAYTINTGRKFPGGRSEEGERMPWLPGVHGKLVSEMRAFVIRVEKERMYSWTNPDKTMLGWVPAAPWYGLVIPRRDVQLVTLATFQRYHVMFQSNSTPEYINASLSALHQWMEEVCTKQPQDPNLSRDLPCRSFRHYLDLLKKSERRPNLRLATPGGMYACFGRERVWDWYKDAEVLEWRTLKVIREFFNGPRISTRYHYTLGPRQTPRGQGADVNKSAAKGLLFGGVWERVRMFVAMLDDNIGAWTPPERPLVVYIQDVKPIECGFTFEHCSERKNEATWLKNMKTWFQGLSDPSHGFEIDSQGVQAWGQAKRRSGLQEFGVVRLWHLWTRAVILGLDRGLDALLSDEARLHMETLIVWDRLASEVPKPEAANPAA